MSVVVTTLLVGCGVLVGRLIARGSTKPVDETKEVAVRREHASDAGEASASSAATKCPDLSAFPCQLGDVVLRRAGDEAWLAGAVVLFDGDAAAVALFVSPEAGGDRAVLARPDAKELLWLSEEKGVTVALGAPPTALEVGTDRFERRRRLPLRAERVGTGAPNFDRDVIFAEYTGLGDDCLVVFASKDRVVAYRGPSLAAGSYDVLPGKATLET